eukprot:2323118-Amphidinium_carterae.1
MSRQGCGIHDLLVHNHQVFPIKLFSLMHRPDLKEEFESIAPFLLDSWSENMIARFNICTTLKRRE